MDRMKTSIDTIGGVEHGNVHDRRGPQRRRWCRPGTEDGVDQMLVPVQGLVDPVSPLDLHGGAGLIDPPFLRRALITAGDGQRRGEQHDT